MTIAIGMFVQDGLIIAADSQETVGENKLNASKIMIANKGESTVQSKGTAVITGAGWTGYLDAVSQAIGFAFMREDFSDLAFSKMLDERVMSFHENHIVRMNNLLSEDRPHVSLIVGECPANQKPHLFRSIESVVSEVPDHCAVGSGKSYANAMLGRYWFEHMTIKSGICLAAYIIGNVKKTIHGCGNLTHIVCISDGHTSTQEDIDKFEDVMRDQVANSDQMFHFVIGFPLNEDQLKEQAQTFCNDLLIFRKRMGDFQNEMEIKSIEQGVRMLDRPPFTLME